MTPTLRAETIGNGVFSLLSHERAEDPTPYLSFWSTWGESAYEAISNGLPCTPPPDVVVHVGGEMFPFHSRLLYHVCPHSVNRWPRINDHNIEFICRGPSHFRALQEFIYTGNRRKLWDYTLAGVPIDSSLWPERQDDFIRALKGLDVRELENAVHRIHDFLFVIEAAVTLDCFIGRQANYVVSIAWLYLVVPKDLQKRWGDEARNEHLEEQNRNAVVREMRNVDYCMQGLDLGSE